MLSEKTLLLNRSEVSDSILSLLDLRIDNFEFHRNLLHMHALENQIYSIDLSDVIAFEDVVSVLFNIITKYIISLIYKL